MQQRGVSGWHSEPGENQGKQEGRSRRRQEVGSGVLLVAVWVWVCCCLFVGLSLGD